MAEDRSIPHEALTYKVIGCAMAVHNQLGPGLKETIYQKALSAKLLEADISFEEEKPVEIVLDDVAVGLLYLDEFVEGALVVEIKAVSHLMTKEEIAQVVTYLAALVAPVGLLINFGRPRLEYKRILPPTNRDAWRDRIKRHVWTRSAHRPSVYPFAIR
jgi:GxxExxY protein